MSSTAERLVESSQEKPKSQLDRLYGGSLPLELAQQHSNYHMLSGGTPHEAYNPNIHTTKRYATPSGIPSEILEDTYKERMKDMKMDIQMIYQQLSNPDTIKENV